METIQKAYYTPQEVWSILLRETGHSFPTQRIHKMVADAEIPKKTMGTHWRIRPRHVTDLVFMAKLILSGLYTPQGVIHFFHIAKHTQS